MTDEGASGKAGCRRDHRASFGTAVSLPVTGGAVHFTEHALYRLVDGRITEVWSLLDRVAVEAQLRA